MSNDEKKRADLVALVVFFDLDLIEFGRGDVDVYHPQPLMRRGHGTV